MKNNLVYMLCAIALFTSCSSAYKTSQTPDDVYYSPGKKIYTEDQYQTYNSSSDDEYLRMKVQDYDRWSSLDDYDYWYDSRYYANNYYSPWTSSFSLGIGFGAYPYYSYSPFYNPWHSWYSPYYTVVYYKNPTVYYRPVNRNNVSTYNNRNYNNYNMPLQNGTRSDAYTNSNSNANRTRNTNFNQDQNNNSRPIRMFNSSSGSSMGMGSGSRMSGGGGGGGVVRTRP